MSAGGAPSLVRPTGAATAGSILFVVPKTVIVDVLLANFYWLRAQWRRVQPWRHFLDPTRLALPKSAQELKLRITTNACYFSRNYAVIFLLILAYFVFSSAALLWTATATAGVSAALRVHTGGEMVALKRTNAAVFKYLRFIISATAVCLVLYVMGSALLSSLLASLAVSAIHATAFARPPSSHHRGPRNRRRFHRR